MKLVDVENFGAVDADSDDLLRDCFQDHPAYLDARANKKFLILGRKGSGKTAIYKRLLTDRTYNVFPDGHSFDDYPWHYHDLQAQTGVPEERRYFHSWKYLILISLAKILLNADQSQPWSEESMDSIAALEDFVVDSYGSRNPDMRQLFSPTKELHFKGALKLPFLEMSGERLKVRELPIHIQEVNRAIQTHIISSLNPENQYYVCFDQLDLGLTKGSGAYQDRLTGLILAARDLYLRARDEGKLLNIVVFLRDDIYQDLHFEDKNKITENYATYVRWGDNNRDVRLMELMERRFKEVLSTDRDVVRWGDVFDETKEMPSRQSKYQHICDRTFMRPRDMIRFVNEVLEMHKSSTEPVDKGFSNYDVHQARDGYSEYLLNELDDEISKHVPNYKEYLEAVKEIGKIQFTLDEFKAAWAHQEAADSASAISALSQLFEFSVVGYLKPGGRGGGSEYVWRYLDDRARFSQTSEIYRVHAGFKEALDLSRSSVDPGERNS